MKIDFSGISTRIPFLQPADRVSVLPERNICSVSPPDDPSDDLITGNGFLRLQVSGRPYDEEIAYTLETLYEPQWKETPLPPDLRPVLPEIRRLLLQQRHDDIDALIDRVQKEAGFEKHMNFSNKIVYPTGSPRLHTAFWLTFRRPAGTETRDYLRWLDMHNGMISSVWTDERGSFRTDSFAACEGNVTVNRFAAPEGQLDLEITLAHPGRPVVFGYSFLNQPFTGSSHRLSVSEDGMLLSWAYNPEFGQKGYVAAVRFIPDGHLHGGHMDSERGVLSLYRQQDRQI